MSSLDFDIVKSSDFDVEAPAELLTEEGGFGDEEGEPDHGSLAFPPNDEQTMQEPSEAEEAGNGRSVKGGVKPGAVHTDSTGKMPDGKIRIINSPLATTGYVGAFPMDASSRSILSMDRSSLSMDSSEVAKKGLGRSRLHYSSSTAASTSLDSSSRSSVSMHNSGLLQKGLSRSRLNYSSSTGTAASATFGSSSRSGFAMDGSGLQSKRGLSRARLNYTSSTGTAASANMGSSRHMDTSFHSFSMDGSGVSKRGLSRTGTDSSTGSATAQNHGRRRASNTRADMEAKGYLAPSPPSCRTIMSQDEASASFRSAKTPNSLRGLSVSGKSSRMSAFLITSTNSLTSTLRGLHHNRPPTHDMKFSNRNMSPEEEEEDICIPEGGLEDEIAIPGEPKELVEASEVFEQSEPQALMEAFELDPVVEEAKRQKRRGQTARSMACLCLVVVGVALLALYLGGGLGSNNDGEQMVTLEPSTDHSLSPTMSPTPYLLPLPEYTVQAIEADFNSPQSLAYLWIQEDPSFESHSDARLLQRFALAAFYYATHGDNWTVHENWLSHDIHECDWHSKHLAINDNAMGVCDEHKNYHALLMTNNGLVGSLPPEIGLLTTMEYLDVATNGIVGTIPTEIGLMGALVNLVVDINKISGTVPTEIGLLTHLNTFMVHTNPITGTIPSEVGLLTNLESLEWVKTESQGTLPTELGMLTNMTRLMLSENQFKGTIPSEIFQMTNLWDAFILNWNGLTGTIPTEIGKLSNVNKIYLNNNYLNGTLPAQLSKVSNATVLALEYNELDGTIPSEVGHLLGLGDLNLCCNKLTGTIPSEVGLLTDLTWLVLEVNMLSSSIPVEIAQNLDKLTMLSLYENFLNGTIPSQVGRMTSLEELYFDWNQLTGSLPSEVGRIPNVAEFWVDYNRLSGQLPAELGNMSSLDTLRLGSNDFSGEIPEDLGNLGATLYWMGLQETLLSGIIPPEVCGIPQLHFNCSSALCGCFCVCLNTFASNLAMDAAKLTNNMSP